MIDRVWHVSQPIASKSCEPATASPVAASAVSRGGTFVARMKVAKIDTSSSSSSTKPLTSRNAGGSKASTERPSDVFSTG